MRPAARSSVTASATASSASAYIGRGYTNNYAGQIDEVAIYASALTAGSDLETVFLTATRPAAG